MPDPTYTIAVCNYNMSATIARAVESMLKLVDERFEILVVDDASTDDSVSVLESLQSEYDNLRIIKLDPDPSRELGHTRNLSIEAANGEYVLLQLDADDVYTNGIRDFVEIFHQLETQLEFDFYLKGNNINIASREFLLNMGPYRNLAVGGEDMDLWRRLFARDAIVWLDHREISHEIGPGKTATDLVQRRYREMTAEFQTGMSFWSYIRPGTSESTKITILNALMAPLAYYSARQRKKYDIPSEFQMKGALKQRIKNERRTLSEIEEEYDVNVDLSELSKEAEKIFRSS